MRRRLTVLPASLLAILAVLPVWSQGAEAPSERSAAGEPEAAAPVEDTRAPRFRFHGEVRLRGEYVANYGDFNDDGGIYLPSFSILLEDDAYGFLDYRARLGLEADLTRRLVGYVEIQAAGAAGTDRVERDVLLANDDRLDVYGAYVHWNQIGSSGWSARVGRQELPMGNQLLFSNLPYYNGITFDAVRFHWRGAIRFDAWWAKTNETFDRDADTDILTTAISDAGSREDEWSVYLHYVRDDAVSGTDRETLWVGGARWTRSEGRGSHLLWNLEVALQAGTIGNPLDPATGVTGEDASIFAVGAEAELGYRWLRGENDHRFTAHAYYGSGDRDPDDDERNDFQPLFQDFHRRNGLADIVRGTNLLSAGLTYRWSHGERHAAGIDLLGFVIDRPETAQTTLALSPGNFTNGFVIPRTGTIIQPDLDPEEDELGQELDLWYDFYYSRHVGIQLLAAVFQPGQAIAQINGFEDPALRLAAQLRLRF